jgi:hypothetical protein
LDLLHYAFVDQVKELWDAGEERDASLFKRAQQLRSVQRFEVDNARAD